MALTPRPQKTCRSTPGCGRSCPRNARSRTGPASSSARKRRAKTTPAAP